MSRPMTSRQAHRAYLNSRRGPRLSKAEEKRMEREEQERIRNEMKQKQAQARAQVARDRKRAKEEEERREKRRKGEPICPVTASQGMISGFLKRDGGSVPKEFNGQVGDENMGNVGGAMPTEPGGGTGDESERGAGSLAAGVAKGKPQDCVVGQTSEMGPLSVGGRVSQGNGMHSDNLVRSEVKGPSETAGDENERDVRSSVDDIAKGSPRDRVVGHASKMRPGSLSDGGRQQGGRRELDDSFPSACKVPGETVGDVNERSEGLRGKTGIGGTGQEVGDDLDDLFLSASQLAREVDGLPPPTGKRSCDEAFPTPEPLSDQYDQTKTPPKDASSESYGLGISSQELLQLDVVTNPTLERPSSGRSLPPDPGKARPPDPPELELSFSESFSLCSQELRFLDSLIAETPQETKQLAIDRNTNITSSPNSKKQNTAGTSPEEYIVEKREEPRPPTNHANISADAITSRQDRIEPPAEDAEEPEEPQRFFTSCTQELIALAEARSRATAESEARRRKNAQKSPQNGGFGDRRGSKARDAKPERRHDESARVDPTVKSAEMREPAQKGHPPQQNTDRDLRRSSSINLDDDAWWEDLDNTDLEALLALG